VCHAIRDGFGDPPVRAWRDDKLARRLHPHRKVPALHDGPKSVIEKTATAILN
jgi:hypothetical protein